MRSALDIFPNAQLAQSDFSSCIEASVPRLAKYVPVGQNSHDDDPRFAATFPPSQIEQSDVAPSMADHVPRAQRVQLKTHAPLDGFDQDPGGHT